MRDVMDHEQSFRGPVLDGPWRGDYIKADSTPIPYINAEGQYGFSEVAKGWYWIACDAAANPNPRLLETA